MRRNAGVMAGAMAIVVSLGLAACSSSTPSASGTTEGTPASAQGGHCDAVFALMSAYNGPEASESTADGYRTFLQQLDQARAGFPPELLGALQAATDYAQSQLDRIDRGEPDPVLSGDPADMQQLATALVTYTQAAFDIETWYRHQCGPPSGSSAWCDAVGEGQRDMAKAYAAGLSELTDPASGTPIFDHAVLGFYQQLRAAAPDDLHAPLDVIIQQYEGNGGQEPKDDASQSARNAAKSTISASITAECGEPLSHLD